ncbi:CHASE2 domain-containing protein [Paenalcaligenes hominis]|uniref:CHASE2 domain-containing protein n=1 Tax=Paenalcaligenes hominis TaxID=643674 RepID=UPI00352686A3
MFKRLPVAEADLARSSLLAGQIKRDWWWTTMTLVIFTAILSLFKTEAALQRLDLVFYDYQSSVTKSPIVPDRTTTHTVLIIIDDYSLEKMGHWPWRRNEYARALDYLSLAKAVGLDIIFQDHNPVFPEDEAFLSYSIAQHGRVALASTVNATQSQVYKPIQSLADAAAAIGYINIYPGRDGVVRNVLLYQDIPPITSHHFTLALLEAAGETAVLKQVLENPIGSNRLIPFIGPAGSFESYSFYDVLNGKVSPQVFKDKYVIIGAWSSGLGDYYPTPQSSHSHTSMSGVEVLANILESTLNNNWIHTPNALLSAVLSVLPVLFICYVLRSLPPRGAIFGTVIVLIWIFIGSWALLNLLNYWVAPSAAIIGTILAYPVWYWRSQETVIRYVNKELYEMRKQDPVLSQAIQTSSGPNSLPERLAHLHKAIELLREAQQRREETLRFISHDMRAPQNSILSLIRMQRADELDLDMATLLNKVENYSKSTLELVDDFMDLARVEAMELSFEVVCLNDVMAEICDEAWVRAKAKHISVHFDEPEQTLWAPIAPKLFKRALINLVDNGIKYSPSHTNIRCALQQVEHTIIITVSDEGWGIPAKDLPTIFQAFKRAHTNRADDPAGSGLGLAFVHTVIARHFGKISVTSTENIGTTFTIEIPAETPL